MWGGGRGGGGMRAREGGGSECKVGHCVWFQLVGVICFEGVQNRPPEWWPIKGLLLLIYDNH